ncbi:MAG: hypothetical protein KBT04_07305 [Bacteroidales bacterium]|nr:hypothetical protein [Candidatus Colimorpha onthohippi]
MKSFLEKIVLLLVAVLLVTACSKDEQEISKSLGAGDYIGTIGEPYSLSSSELSDCVYNTLQDSYLSLSQYEQDFKMLMALMLNGGVKVTRLEYYTTDADGSLVKASGIIAWTDAVEKSGTYDRIVSVSHSTCDIDKAPTKTIFPIDGLVLFNTLHKNVIVMADYLGYGSRQKPDLSHPYLHAKLTGTASADMFEAAERYLSEKTSLRPEQSACPIQLCGYSQGGHGAIATLYEMQRRGYTNRICRVDAGAGAFDLMTMWNVFGSLQYVSYNRMGFVPYIIRGLSYGRQNELDLHNIYTDKIFRVDSTGYSLYNLFETTMLSTWHQKLGTDITQVLNPDIFKQDITQANKDVQALYQMFAANSLVTYDTPDNPSIITLYHTENDDQVPYECSLSAQTYWPEATLVNLTLAPGNHMLCAFEYFVRLLDDNQGNLWTSLSSYISPILEGVLGD